MKDSIAESLHKLTHQYRSKMKEAIDTSGVIISVSHIRTLKCIKHINSCTASDIANRISLDKSQVTRILKDLVSEKHVEKIRDPSNHRSQLLNLTNSGNELLIEITKLNTHVIQTMTTGLTDQEVKDFIHIANIMASNLQQAESKTSGVYNEQTKA
ncbi:MarR family winged helix-turn-helix transcriptional regulator [Marinomonas colpomeniae]|uniref:Winged helix-turn-helix transcriptional regulator n=1 Tax=Marinomonas colpomeniae TaxID=2774408 RepID=A0ABR8P418_9GAMM|nr:MarR family winged helix-turn-helix transcriptional regulator [Marinomonas colpomeniae]MBD5772082.1 winged helix-turn-helix transcriptional regulator [Marinomonas colpomeniae]